MKKIEIKKPKNILLREIKVDSKEATKAILKTGINIISGKWDDLSESTTDLISCLGLKNSPEQTSWLLIYRSINRALKKILDESPNNKIGNHEIEAIRKRIKEKLSTEKFILDDEFIKNPGRSDISSKISSIIEIWLTENNFNNHEAKSIKIRLESYINLSFHEEWDSSPNDYNPILECGTTPFSNSVEIDISWIKYKAWLHQQISKPMFLDEICLKQLYVPLRGWYKLKSTPDETYTSKVNVIDIYKYITSWISEDNKDDPIKLISGGPGSGKSSFAKIFTALHSNETNTPLIFIPLHHFELSGDIFESIDKFLKLQGILKENPIDNKVKTVVVFDGLDELSLQGKVGERAAKQFIHDLIRKAEQANHIEDRVRFIITGRELIIQSNENDFKKQGQIINVLPFHIEKSNYKFDFVDKDKLIKLDQRQKWWRSYGEATGLGYHGLPEKLDNKELSDVTSQPLLNYLVALSFQRGSFNLAENLNLNSIYSDLLKAVYERGWSSNQHSSIRGLSEKHFTRILEEIGLSSWHGDGRTTTINDIERQCTKSGISKLLDNFQHNLINEENSKVTQLLTAFYFRQSGENREGDRTFEFTHKSFGEYLTARRIIREVTSIERKLEEHDNDPDEGIDVKEALEKWINIFAMSNLDTYLLNFVTGEISKSEIKIQSLQKSIIRMINYYLCNGIPLERMQPRPSFNIEYEFAKRVEESLFIMLCKCAELTKQVSHINWPNKKSFGEVISRVVAQRQFEQSVFLENLKYLNLKGSILTNQHFWHADFSYSDLTNVNLVGADLRYSTFFKAVLVNCNLVYSNLSGANFSFAKFGVPGETSKNIFSDIDDSRYIVENSLVGTKFNNADLTGVHFGKLDIRSCHFSDAILNDTVFEGTIITKSQRDFFNKNDAQLINVNLVELPVDESVDEIGEDFIS